MVGGVDYVSWSQVSMYHVTLVVSYKVCNCLSNIEIEGEGVERCLFQKERRGVIRNMLYPRFVASGYDSLKCKPSARVNRVVSHKV